MNLFLIISKFIWLNYSMNWILIVRILFGNLFFKWNFVWKFILEDLLIPFLTNCQIVEFLTKTIKIEVGLLIHSEICKKFIRFNVLDNILFKICIKIANFKSLFAKFVMLVLGFIVIIVNLKALDHIHFHNCIEVLNMKTF